MQWQSQSLASQRKRYHEPSQSNAVHFILMTEPFATTRTPSDWRNTLAKQPATSRVLALLATIYFLAPAAHAQIGLTTAVDLALRNSPRVQMAQADVAQARAALNQTRDVYIPAVEGAIDLGYSYGAPLGEPTLFSFTTHSLVFNYSQKDYARAALSGLAAANLYLADARQGVAEDTATTYLALDSAQQRHSAMAEELTAANQLVKIIQDRLDLGQDTRIELLQGRRTATQIRLQMLQLDDQIEGYRSHLNHLTGMPDGPFVTETATIPNLPEIPSPSSVSDQPAITLTATTAQLSDTPAVAAAVANARAKREQAFGDARYLYRPQIAFFAQYSRFSTFNNYQIYYPAFASNTLNAFGIGVNISIPFYDRSHQDKAAESSAIAAHAEQQARSARNDMFEGRTKLQHASAELATRAELASFDQQIAQQQLDAVLVQLQAGNGNPSAAPLTPKDEQNARIQERQRYLELLDARSKLSETQIQLLRLTGQLEDWLKSAVHMSPPTNR
jgi:outer membrane protein TolC